MRRFRMKTRAVVGNHRVLVGMLLLLSAFAGSVAFAAGTSEAPPADPPKTRPIPAYQHDYDDGLYSTLVTMLRYGAPEIEKQKSRKLKIEGFKREIKVRSIVQDKEAPLVVVLVGVDGKADSPLG